MPEEVPVAQIPLVRQFPILRMFDAAGLALSPVSIVIAALAAVALTLSGWLVDRVLPLDERTANVRRLAAFSVPGSWAGSGLQQKATAAIMRPWSSTIEPFLDVLSPQEGQNVWVNGALRFAIAIGLWSLIGVILCRRAAFLFAGNDESTLLSTIDYGSKRWPASIGAPLIPLAATLLFALTAATIGFLGRLPLLGSIWLVVMSPFEFILGLGMAILLLATALSWPLMIAAVSIEDCDSFGGLSRAYSSFTSQPWKVIVYFLLSLIIGGVLMSLVNLVAETTIWSALSSTSFGSGKERAHESLLIPLVRLLQLFELAIGICYFWSAATVIYLLLRLDVDGVPLDRIAVDDHARATRDPFPVVGIPAAATKPESNGVAVAP